MELPAHIALGEVGNQEWNRKNLAIEEFDTKLGTCAAEIQDCHVAAQ